MTEEEWLACEKPGTMLRALCANARKLRLFACACCQRVADQLTQTERDAVAIVERFAEGLASVADRRDTVRALVLERGGEFVLEERGNYYASISGLELGTVAVARVLVTGGDDLLWDQNTGRRIVGGGSAEGEELAQEIVECSLSVAAMGARKLMTARIANRRAVGRVWNKIVRSAARVIDGFWMWENPNESEFKSEWSAQTLFLRDIFGNPFRPVAFNPAWRTDTAVSLARGMYDSREFGAMPILADALQDAGCEDEHILNHCRDAGGGLGEPARGSTIQAAHVRGCWVCDLVLGLT